MSPRHLLAGVMLAASAIVIPVGSAAAAPPPLPAQVGDPAPCTGIPPQATQGKCVRPDIWEWLVQGQ